MKNNILKLFNIENTKTFILFFFILIIFNETIKNYFINFYYISHNLVFWYWFLFSIFISFRIILFLIFNFNANKIFTPNIIFIIIQIFLPLIFIIKYLLNASLWFVFVLYFLVFFLIILILRSLKDIKTKIYSIKKSFIEYRFDFIELWVFYFLLSFFIPIIFLLILWEFFKKIISLEVIIYLLFLPLSTFFLYFFFNYLIYLKKLKRIEFSINNEFIYIKLLIFYKFKKISILDQIYIFISYFIKSINIKYVEFLKNYKQEWNLYEYLSDNFYKELLFKDYRDKLKEIVNNFPEINLDFERLYTEIYKKNLSKHKSYILDRESFFYCFWIKKTFNSDYIPDTYIRENIKLNKFEQQILNFINVEILLVKRHSKILLEEKIIEYIDYEINNSLKSISYKLINWMNRSIFIIFLSISSLTWLLLSILNESWINVIWYLLRVIWSNQYKNEINNIFLELTNSNFNFDNLNNLLVVIWYIFLSLIIILYILLNLWLLSLWIRIYMMLFISKLSYIKKYIKFELQQKNH